MALNDLSEQTRAKQCLRQGHDLIQWRLFQIPKNIANNSIPMFLNLLKKTVCLEPLLDPWIRCKLNTKGRVLLAMLNSFKKEFHISVLFCSFDHLVSVNHALLVGLARRQIWEEFVADLVLFFWNHFIHRLEKLLHIAINCLLLTLKVLLIFTNIY